MVLHYPPLSINIRELIPDHIVTHICRYDAIDINKTYIQYPYHQMNKPKGLWYSYGHYWLDFLQRIDPHASKYDISWKYSSLFKLDIDLTKILRISTKIAFEYFVEEYSYLDSEQVRLIAWEKVSETYDGVDFYNYFDLKSQIKGTCEYSWFDSLDFPSGCIWNLDAIKYIEELTGESILI